MEAMWMKFHPYYQALVEEVHSGSIGRVGSVRASFGLPFGEPDSGRWSAERSSSTLLDQGIYPVTFAVDVLGDPIGINSAARIRDDGVDLTVHTTLEFAGGQRAQLAASMVEYIDPSASVSGTEGWIAVPAPFWASSRYTRHIGPIGEALMTPTTVDFEREGFGYLPMLRAVTDAVLAGSNEHPIHPLSATLSVARILDTIRAASATPTISMEIHA
jgi:predicted dehydrogenase